MFRLAIRSVVARWGRLVLTSLAIIVSTAFLSGTFVFRDTIQRTFDALFAAEFERVDAYVQSANTVEVGLGFETRDRIPVNLVDAVSRVDGVVAAQPFVQDDAVVIAKSGKPVERRTGPTFGGTLNTGNLSVWKLVDGRAPNNSKEVALDRSTAEDAKYVVGDTVKVNSEGGSRDFALVGIVEYNDIATPQNATWALFDAKTAEEFVAKPGFVDAILVKGEAGLTDEQVVARVSAVLPASETETLTAAQITKQTQSEVGKALGFVTLFLAIFSFIALGVGCFVIYNVFSITTAQRQRENALLRAIGASRRQITWAAILEAVAVGLFGSLIGLVGGVGLALGIRNLLSVLGFKIPARGLVLDPRTVLVTLVAGLAATLVAALAPALAAGRVPPVAAMNETAFERTGHNRWRIGIAFACLLGGIATIFGVMSGADGQYLALALLLIFTGVLLIGPAMARPIARVLGAPIERWRGITGSMAKGNVQRNPKRTARTAAPVLIGVALVTGASVFAASIKDQLRETFGKTFIGDYVINSTNGGSLSFNQSIVDELNTLPEVGAATGLGFARLAFADGKSALGTTIDPTTAGELLQYRFVQGGFADLTPDGLLISQGEAKRRSLAVGSTVRIKLTGTIRTLKVEGIYASDRLATARVYHRALLDGTSLSNTAGFVFMTRAPGVSDEHFRTVVDQVVKRYGIGELQDRGQFIAGRSDIVDQSLTFIYGLLALSIVIAVFGIVLTLLLAVYERRRETGLLRAVGMTRAQVRTTVRWESVITSLYGAVVGVVMGLVLGYVVIVSLRDQGLTTYSVPVPSIVVILIIAFAVGVLAAVIPARRATRLDILRAIAADG